MKSHKTVDEYILACGTWLPALTKQREFADYISEAKRKETKMKRLEKIIPLILEIEGLYDKYK